jgi:hypothetical protein
MGVVGGVVTEIAGVERETWIWKLVEVDAPEEAVAGV